MSILLLTLSSILLFTPLETLNWKIQLTSILGSDYQTLTAQLNKLLKQSQQKIQERI